ncbi:hypothetical protein K2173_003274 [Erythroxylum novogranatense]|uniref:RNase H type-1 domain-containing protein n=1 Tax=Erythroxylum novogranatense TaxID=1862640 RepID=A0AAV8SX52_9ROSI|nr:hypothetical protein K2173_003274 [Erythroxylum novogranatense]
MNALSRAFSYATTLLGREAHFPYSRSFCTKVLTFSCKRSFEQYGLKAANLQILLTRFHAQCCSSRRVSGKSSRKKKPIPEPVVGEKRKDDFFVIRKGDVVGVYKRLDDCQTQAGSSVSDPPVTYGLTYDFMDHLRKHIKLDNHAETHCFSDDHNSYILEFDGASKGNPGQAGAGAVLWKADGSLIAERIGPPNQ